MNNSIIFPLKFLLIILGLYRSSLTPYQYNHIVCSTPSFVVFWLYRNSEHQDFTAIFFCICDPSSSSSHFRYSEWFIHVVRWENRIVHATKTTRELPCIFPLHTLSNMYFNLSFDVWPLKNKVESYTGDLWIRNMCVLLLGQTAASWGKESVTGIILWTIL